MTKRNNNVRGLIPWHESDGEYIHLVTLKQALPDLRWDLYLIGTTGSSFGSHRTRPLLGRLRRNRVVVLLSSFCDWLTHYNPDQPSAVTNLLDYICACERNYLSKLQAIRADVRAKSGDPLGRKLAPKPSKDTGRPLKVTSNEVFGVWK